VKISTNLIYFSFLSPSGGGMGVVEVRAPLTEKELRKVLKTVRKHGVWSKLFGIAKTLPEFQESDRVDARV